MLENAIESERESGKALCSEVMAATIAATNERDTTEAYLLLYK